MIYLDNAATTKVDPLVVKKMLPYFTEKYGNPSSYHRCGREACDAIENARYEIASFLVCAPNEIIFTSGATESNNIAIKSCALVCNENEKYNFIFSSIEHKSVLNVKDWLECQGHEVREIECLPSGQIDFDHFESLIDDKTLFCSCMYINNETGIFQPVEKIGKICKENDIVFHIDATQAVGKYELSLASISADFVSASAHKLHGPKGAGLLFRRRSVPFKGLIEGGSQEQGRRAGTENVAGIVGFAEAIRIAKKSMDQNLEYVQDLENYLLSSLKNSNIKYKLNGDLNYKSPFIFNISFGVEADDLMDQMENFCFSKSSACSKGYKPSHVLESMDVPEDIIKTSIRISFSKYTTKEEIDLFIEEISKAQSEL